MSRLPTCKTCVHLYERDITSGEAQQQFREEVAAHLFAGAPEPPYYCCGHEVTRQANRYVAAYEMRTIGAACGREGLLWEERGE